MPQNISFLFIASTVELLGFKTRHIFFSTLDKEARQIEIWHDHKLANICICVLKAVYLQPIMPVNTKLPFDRGFLNASR